MSTGSASASASVARSRWLTFLCLTLLGYALFGKGWAYVGLPPVYVGEVVLCCGVVSFVLFGRWSGTLDVPPTWLLLMLAGWGVICTLPDVPRYGAEALRDAVIWGYGAFALIVCGTILAQPRRLAVLLQRYKQFSLIFPAWVPVAWILCRFFEARLPRWPWANTPVMDAKGGDMLVHLAGILAFGVAGFGGGIGLLRLMLLACCVGLVGAFDRAGLFSFLAVFGVCFLHNPHERSLWRLTALGICGLILLAVTDLRIQMPGREREVSFHQLVANLGSLGGATRTGDLDETKEWRLQWWNDIIDYTVNGKYFWTGKGFGINLAEDDGYIGSDEPTLRSPHNSHLTMLARAGVPGFVLWVLVQLSWACCILGAYVQSRRLGQRHWPGLFLVLLAYWIAFMMNSSFDVVLEGPMGGIWLWTVYGVGLAALWLYWHNPTVLDDDMAADVTAG